MFEKVKVLFSSSQRATELRTHLQQLRQRVPVPVFWLFGKTQSGKTSVIKFLTGADEAEIGQGFRPCTRFSRQYRFPTPEAPLLSFLDTRGLDEPGYDAAEDLAAFDPLAHVVIVTVRVLDHAQENVLASLKQIRQAQSHRPIVLLLTCLHEAYPQEQHPLPYPFRAASPASFLAGASSASPLERSLAEQCRRFADLVDQVVPIDLTPPEEGFNDPTYGGTQLKQVLLEVLPAAYRQTLLTLEEATRDLQDLYARQALPHIIGYSVLAASAGSIPVPWLDLLILPGLQTRMIYHLARFYGQPLSGTRFVELAGTLGLGMVMRQAVREAMKLIPLVGSVAGGALAGASTFALGKAFCYYYSAVHQGHVPRSEDLRRYYQEQLREAERSWLHLGGKASAGPNGEHEAGPA
jgi:uncharacterized protein (DUF697 family)